MRRYSGVARLCLVVASAVFALGGASLAWADEPATIVESSVEAPQTELVAQTAAANVVASANEAAVSEDAAGSEVTQDAEVAGAAEVTTDDSQELALSEDLDASKYQAMYRLYNPYTGEHLYTADVDECAQLETIGWRFEGVGWIAPKSSETPVYRLFNKYNDDHHYTTSLEERDALVKIGWTSEGIGWFSEKESTGEPLYRQFNPYAERGTHNYTADKHENDELVKLGWKAEGVGWYGLDTDDASIEAAALDARTTALETYLNAVYNYSYYVEHNSDAVSASTSRADALTHFVAKGMDEGRVACAGFDVQSYYNANQDLRETYGTNLRSYYTDYIKTGQKQSRVATGRPNLTSYCSKYNGFDYSLVYDGDYYRSNNADLDKAFTKVINNREYVDDIALIQHFYDFGMNEGRRGNATFDVKSYWLEYQDVRVAAKGYYKGCYEHYVLYGQKEGRHASGCTKLKTTSGASAQSLIVSYAKNTKSPGAGLCSEWVSQVFEKLGFHDDKGDACDHYNWYCTSSKKSELKTGMIIAVPSHSHTKMGKKYGHVCIYIGNGKVMDNVGYIRTMSLDKWLSYYGTTYTPKWGWFHGISLE